MQLIELQQHIQKLATLEDAPEPIVNCYLNVDARYRKALTDQVHTLKTTMSPEVRVSFWEALGRIEVFLGTNIRTGSKGVAIFARAGSRPFFLPLQFGAPLPNHITISHAPQIYPLVEIRDNYYRYVVLVSSEESASILELSIGTITEAKRLVRPDLRQRGGREWTKEHCQSHAHARNQQFINEQIRSLDQVTTSGEYKHLILAGNARTLAQLNEALPKRLSNMVISNIRASDKEKTSDLVAASLAAFEEHEEVESLAVVSRLGFEIGTNGAAVKGTQACIAALRDGRAHILIMSQSYDPGLGGCCRSCRELLAENLVSCPRCGQPVLPSVDIKEEMVRMAEQNHSSIEIVKTSDAMNAFEGVGCLLRYLTPEKGRRRAA
jgi:protein required for attachment to host cells